MIVAETTLEVVCAIDEDGIILLGDAVDLERTGLVIAGSGCVGENLAVILTAEDVEHLLVEGFVLLGSLDGFDYVVDHVDCFLGVGALVALTRGKHHTCAEA